MAILLHLEFKVGQKPKQLYVKCPQYTDRDYCNGLLYGTQLNYCTEVSYNGTKIAQDYRIENEEEGDNGARSESNGACGDKYNKSHIF